MALPGIEGFYVGLLHPLSVPSQLMALVSLGVIVGLSPQERVVASYATFAASMLLGIILGQFGVTLGWEEFAPYKGIIVTAGSPSVPKRLLNQLCVGGRLVIPTGDRRVQVMKIITKVSEKKFETEEVPNFAFVPLIGKEGWKEE